MESNLFTLKWSPAAKDKLAELVEAGLTGGQISRQLSSDFGVHFSRNSVISQIVRSGLQLKGQSRRQIGEQRARVASPLLTSKKSLAKPRPIEPSPRADMLAQPEPAPQGDVDHGCRWMHGDPLDRNFCGADRYKLTRYCSHHYARATVETPPAKTKALDKWARYLSRK